MASTSFSTHWRISLLFSAITLTAGAADWPAAVAKFQTLHTQILSNAPATAWRTDLEKLANLTGDDVATKTVRELSRVWLARVQLLDLDVALRDYYRHNARYPTTLDRLEPARLRIDPWGDPWSYRLRAPSHFSKLTTQDYVATPRRFPGLTPLATAIKTPPPTPPAWKIMLQEVGGNKALQIGTALIQPGASIDSWTLVQIANHTALFAGLDYFIEVKF